MFCYRESCLKSKTKFKHKALHIKIITVLLQNENNLGNFSIMFVFKMAAVGRDFGARCDADSGDQIPLRILDVSIIFIYIIILLVLLLLDVSIMH